MLQKLKDFLEEKGDEVKAIAYESSERENYPTKDVRLFGVVFPVYERGSPIDKVGFFQNIWYQSGRWAHYQILNKKEYSGLIRD